VTYRCGKLQAAEAGEVMQQADADDDANGDGDDADAGSCDWPALALTDSSVETKLTPPPRRDAEPRFVAHVAEYRANPVVSRRGYLLITDDAGKDADESSPVKRWVVSYRTGLYLCFSTHRVCIPTQRKT